MIKHIVFIKLNDNSQEQKEELKKRLLSLKDHIDVLRYIEVGLNFSKEERAYDIALITEFETKEDLDIYAKDSYHQEVISYIKGVANSSKVVDYEY
jgi:hypothetical protein